MEHRGLTLLLLAALASPARAAADFTLTASETFSPGSTPTVRVSGYGFSYLHFRLYRLERPEDTFLAPEPPAASTAPVAAAAPAVPAPRPAAARALGGLRAAAPARWRERAREALTLGWVPPFEPREAGGVPVDAELPLVTAWGRSFVGRSWVYEEVPLPLPGPGVYVVEAAAGGESARTLAVLGDLAFDVKRSSDGVAVYCADRTTGRPWPGAAVWSLAAADGERLRGTMLAKGRSDAEGLWRGPAAGRGLVLARSGRHFAAARVDAPYGDDPAAKVYLYTDRPVYRPGHKVYFKGVARRADGAYWSPERGSVKVVVRDPKGGERLARDFSPSEAGTFDGELQLPDEPPLGRWTVAAQAAGGADSAAFEVQEYRKPEFKAAVRPEAPDARLGGRATFTVTADYFFGAPAAGAAVEWTLTRVPFWSWRPDDPMAEDGEEYSYEYGGRMLERGEGTLDDAGRLSVAVDLPPQPAERWWSPRDFRFRLSARVTDAAGRQQAAEGSVLATQGDFYIRLSKDRGVGVVGETVPVGVAAVGYDGSARDAVVTWSLEREGGPARLAAGTLGGTMALPKGGAEIPFVPQAAGPWRLSVTARDAGGRLVTAQDWLWVAGAGASVDAGPGRLMLLTDKKAYKPGETVRIAAAAPGGGPVRLTVEGRGVQKTLLVRAPGPDGLVRLAVSEQWAPSVRLTASAFEGGRVLRAARTLKVSPDRGLVRVTVTPDRPEAGPDEEVGFTVTAKGADGRPAQAEVSLGVVDEAVYAVVPELAPPIEDYFFAARPPRVTTADSTQFWVQGRSRRGRGRELALAEDFEGDDVKAGLAPARVRRRFEDTMAWVARVPTGPDGTAFLRLRTPDNLTAWRATVRASDRLGRVGQGAGRLVTTKKLLVRLETPRVWVRGDETVVTAVVHNLMKEDAEARVTLAVSGPLSRLDAPGERRVAVGAGKTAKLSWRLRAAAPGTAKVSVTALSEKESDAMELSVPVKEHGVERAVAASGRLTGSAEAALTLPPTADPATARLSLTLSPSAASALVQALPDLMGYPYGCVEQTMSRFGPTLAAARAFRELDLPKDGLPKDLDKMVGQGVSRLTGFQHGDGGWGWWKDDATHPFMSAYALWGLWQAKREGFPVDAGVLARGRAAVERQLAASFEAGKDDDSGSSYGAGSGGPRIRAFMLFVLSHMPDEQGTARALAERAAGEAPRMPPQARALYALALKNLGFPERAREQALVLTGAARREAGVARWTGQSFDHGWHDEATQTTAAALRALTAAAPGDPTAAEALNGLLQERSGKGWASTQDTAAAAYALVDYLKGAPRGAKDLRAAVSLDGAAPRAVPLPASAAPATETFPVPSPGEHRVALSLDGDGEVFYTAALTYRDAGEDLRAEAAPGLSVTRRYERLVPASVGGEPGYEREGLGGLKAGDLVLVTLETESAEAREFFMLEDFLPAGFEEAEGLAGAPVAGLGKGWAGEADQRERRDDRIAYFKSRLPSGKTVFRTVLRAELAGRPHALPALAQLPYRPSLRASSDEAVLDVGE